MSKRDAIQSRSEIVFENASLRVVLETGPARRGISSSLTAFRISPLGLTTQTSVVAVDTQSRAAAGQRSVDLLHRVARKAAEGRIEALLARLAAETSTVPTTEKPSGDSRP